MEKTILITIFTVIITLILNKLLGNILYGIMIFLFKPFKKGDRITISNFRGDLATGTVIKRTLLNIHLMDYERNVHLIPNILLENNAIVNSNIKEGINRVNSIKISPDSNLEKAEKIIQGILINDEDTINTEDNTNLLLKTTDRGLELEYNVRNSTDVFDSFDICNKVKKEIIIRFQKEDDIILV